MAEFVDSALPLLGMIVLMALIGGAIPLVRQYSKYLELGGKDKQVSILETNLAIIANGAANAAEIGLNMFAAGKLKNVGEVLTFVQQYLKRNLPETVAQVQPTEKQLANLAEAAVSRVQTAREAATPTPVGILSQPVPVPAPSAPVVPFPGAFPSPKDFT